jgi:hypothetical protein
MIIVIIIQLMVYFHVIEPMFKKSYNRFDFEYVSDDTINYTWDFIMVEVLPKIKEDGLYDDTMSKSLNDLDLVSLFNAIMVVINKNIFNIYLYI